MRPFSRFRRQPELLERRDAPALIPVGPEFQINTYSVGQQSANMIAMDDTGNFVTAWTSFDQDGSGMGVFGQRYNSAGVPQGGEFQVNSYTLGNQQGSGVAMDADGDFVVMWNSQDQIAGSDIFAQRYDSLGVAQGGEFQVNTVTGGHQTAFGIGMDSSGNFAIAWQSNNEPGGSGYGVYGQRFNAAGMPLGSEFHVNTYTTGNQRRPKVAVDSNGDFCVTWYSYHDGSGKGIFAQRFNAVGSPQGTEFRVNTQTIGDQGNPDIAIDGAGNFVVVWTNYVNGFDYDVYAQRYNAAGQPAGSEFRVNTYTTSFQTATGIAMDADGDFIIAWHSYQQNGTGSDNDCFAQRFNAAGVPQDTEFLVNTTTSGRQVNPRPAMNAAGDVVVIMWQGGPGQSGSVYEIFGQCYANVAPPRIQSVQVNDGSAQRSRVTSLTVPFNQIVTLGSGTPANAFTLSGPSGSIALAVDLSLSTATQIIAKLTFSGPGTEFGSLADGRYTLTVLAIQVVDAYGQALDGNGDGTPGDDYVLIGSPANGLFRLFGDADGDGDVDTGDFVQFRLALGGTSLIFDFDNDGAVSTSDFIQFRLRFGGSV